MKSIADMLREEARKEEREKTNIKVIRNALNAGMEVDVIAQITGLSREEVEKIIENLGD